MCIVPRPSTRDDTNTSDLSIDMITNNMRKEIKDLKKILDSYNGHMVHIEHKLDMYSDDAYWMKDAHQTLIQEIESIKKRQHDIENRF